MPAEAFVSCLMVTLASASRRGLAYGAIADYCAQTYPRRELIVAIDPRENAESTALKAHIAALNRDDIRVIEPSGPLSLGALRNLCRASAKGDVHCQWDDDDHHHPERLAAQLAALDESKGDAIGLQEAMQYFPATRSLFWTNWRLTAHKILPGTLMFRAGVPARYPEYGEVAQLGEDTAFCEQISKRDGLRALAGAPHLLVYVSHGANSWDDGHHAMLAARLGLSQGLLRRREAQIRQMMQPYDLGAGPIQVCGPNGLAFVIDR